MVRLFVGGLAHDTTSDQLASRFETFGKVTDCITIGPKGIEPFTKPGTTCRGFGYLSLEPANDSALRRCLTVVHPAFVEVLSMQYNGSRWRGGVLRVQPAQQHFLEKLRLEWAEESVNDEERRHKGKEENDQAQELSVVPPSKTPLVLVCPDGKEFEVRPNKRRTVFAEHDIGKPSAAAWESIPTPPRLQRREVFAKEMEASFDATAARQAWKEDLQATVDTKSPPSSPASSEELGAVDFADDEFGVDQKVLDLSRFSDDEE